MISSPAYLSLFDEILSNNERFTVVSVGLYKVNKTFCVNLKDTAKRTIMTIAIVIGGGGTVGTGSRVRYVDLFQLTSESGQLLLTAKEFTYTVCMKNWILSNEWKFKKKNLFKLVAHIMV